MITILNVNNYSMITLNNMVGSWNVDFGIELNIDQDSVNKNLRNTVNFKENWLKFLQTECRLPVAACLFIACTSRRTQVSRMALPNDSIA